MFRVYVIQLQWHALKIDTGRGMSATGLPYLYVGSTWHTPEQRLAKHRVGGSGTSSKVRNFGLGLRPELYRHLGAVLHAHEAKMLEMRWAQDLADVGFPTLSDGKLRRPKGKEVNSLTTIAPDVEDVFDEVAFALCAHSAEVNPGSLSSLLRKRRTPDGSWRRIGRFSHVAEHAVVTRLKWLQDRGFLHVAATGAREGS